MKKLFSFFVFILVSTISLPSPIFKEPSKVPKRNLQSIKIDLGCSLETLLASSTSTMREITELIDHLVCRVKELSGQQDGPLAVSDKEALILYQKKVDALQEMLHNLEQELKNF